MKTRKQIVTNEQMNTAFANSYSNFDNDGKRKVMIDDLTKVKNGFYISHTISVVLKELKLIKGSVYRPVKISISKKGEEYLSANEN